MSIATLQHHLNCVLLTQFQSKMEFVLFLVFPDNWWQNKLQISQNFQRIKIISNNFVFVCYSSYAVFLSGGWRSLPQTLSYLLQPETTDQLTEVSPLSDIPQPRFRFFFLTFFFYSSLHYLQEREYCLLQSMWSKYAVFLTFTIVFNSP